MKGYLLLFFKGCNQLLPLKSYKHFFLIVVTCFISFQKATASYYLDNALPHHQELRKAVEPNNPEVLEFLTHGQPGKLLINQQWLGSKELIPFFRDYLKSNPTTKHINLYGCEFGKGIEGLAAVKSLEDALNITISASNNITGQGGDWNLEIGKPYALKGLDNLPLTLQCAGTVGGTLPSDDYDGDGVCNDVDVDDDNDGILDTVEYMCSKHQITMADLGIGANGDHLNGTSDVSAVFGLPTGTISIQYTNLNISSTAGMTVQNNSSANSTLATTTFQITSSKSFLVTLEHGRVMTTNLTKDYYLLNTPNNYVTPTFTPSAGYIEYNSSTEVYVQKNGGGTFGTSSSSFSWDITEPLESFNFTAGTTDYGGGRSGYWFKICIIPDTDQDGLPNHLDLDSDGDGCPDAVEGGGSFTNINLTPSASISGGNSGTDYNGTTQYPVKGHLGTSVDANGLPTAMSGTAQTLGTSADILSQPANCVSACGGIIGGIEPQDDYDGDGICNDVDVDDDNDGILDTDEYLCTKHRITMADLGIASSGSGLNGTTDVSSVFGLAPGTISIQYSNLQGSPGSQMFLSNNEANTDPKNNATFQITSSKEFLLTLSHGRTITSYQRTDFFTLNTPNNYAVQAFTPKDGFDVTTSSTTLSVYKNTESANLATISSDQQITWNFSQPLKDFNFTAGTTDWQGGGSGYNFEICMIADTDQDGIPNHRDLDSDGDGCPDALEGSGSFTSSDLSASSSIPGGNSGSDYNGTSSNAVTNNLGTSSESNGLPSLSSGTSQGIGSSTDGSTKSLSCCEVTPTITDHIGPECQTYTSYMVAFKTSGNASSQISISPETLSASFNASEQAWYINDIPEGTDIQVTVTEGEAYCQISKSYSSPSDCLGALGTEIKNFKVSRIQEGILVSWELTDQTNLKAGNLEKGPHLEELKSVSTFDNAAGNYFNYIDKNPTLGGNYYRLKLIDKDGLENWTKIKHINYDTHDLFAYVAPNPVAQNKIELITTLEDAIIEVFEVTGNNIRVNIEKNLRGYAITPIQAHAKIVYLSVSSKSGFKKVFKVQFQ